MRPDCLIRMASNHKPPSTGPDASTPGGRPERAILEFESVVRTRPGDPATAEALAARLVDSADAAASAGQCAEALAYLSVVANWRESRGDKTQATELRTRIERLELAYLESQLALAHPLENAERIPEEARRSVTPNRTQARDMRTQAQHARACVARGDAIGAAKHLNEEMAEGNPVLMLAIAEIQLRAGRHDRGIALIGRAIAEDPSIGTDAVHIGIELARRQPDAGFALLERVTDTWVAQSQWPLAIAALREFIEQQPDYVPAAVRLRELESAASGAADDKRVVPFRRALPVAVKSRTA